MATPTKREGTAEAELRAQHKRVRLTAPSPGGALLARPPEAPHAAADSKLAMQPPRRLERAPSSSERGSKGLRQFSLRVCQKVEEKGTTTYVEVAEELVREMRGMNEPDESYEQKNIRRRVYDALNVLMAMNIIRKEKKEIRWVGLPTSATQEMHELERQQEERAKAVESKRARLQELVYQKIMLRNLIAHNEEAAAAGGEPDPAMRVNMPFILIKTDQDTVIDCEMSEDKSYYHLKLNKPFELHDEIGVLNKMEMHRCTQAEYQAMLSPEMAQFLPDHPPSGAAMQLQRNQLQHPQPYDSADYGLSSQPDLLTSSPLGTHFTSSSLPSSPFGTPPPPAYYSGSVSSPVTSPLRRP